MSIRDDGGRAVGVGLPGVVAVLALLWVGQRAPAPSPAGGSFSPQQGRDTARPVVPSASGTLSFDGGTRLLAAFFGDPPVTAAGAVSPTLPRLTVGVDFDVVIATLPDPFGSHLDYAYDANLEAIQLAFADAGFLLDRFWLPERGDSLRVPDPLRSASPRDSMRISAHERHPGVILCACSLRPAANITSRTSMPTGRVRWRIARCARLCLMWTHSAASSGSEG